MIFPYTEYTLFDGRKILRPTLPVRLKFGRREIPIIDALVDTGADQTLLPLAFASEFGFQFDPIEDKIDWQGAGGHSFPVYKSPEPIEICIDTKGFRPKYWKATVYFTLQQPTILLGHKGFLEHFDLTFRGSKKVLEVNI
ncbi:MAG TPA: hypothetical protein VI873_01910 [Candidatus Peribacteraceae bacterium]|nr:hypothetical protein [Candidatus Peribacteraceae bacterium]